MVAASFLLLLAGAINLFINATHPLKILPASGKSAGIEKQPHIRPLYVIAHKVLTTQGVDDAIKHGANALEMDMTAWKEGWWCDHDGTKTSWHASASDQFRHVAQRRKEGKNIQFVWLDIKNPNYCDLDNNNKEVCSIKGLQKLARGLLEPAGVKVLYGFSNAPTTSRGLFRPLYPYFAADGKAFKYVRDDLNANEAINYDGSGSYGSPNMTPEESNNALLDVPFSHKVGSYGDDHLEAGFGKKGGRICYEEDWYTCTVLRQAKHSGNWARVFGWTVTAGQSALVKYLFHDAGVDGVIYGSPGKIYGDSPDFNAAASIVLDWIKAYSDFVKVADTTNPPP